MTSKSSLPTNVGSNDGLGQLPERVDLLQATWQGDREFMRPVGDYYSEDQMRTYAAEQVAAERERWRAEIEPFLVAAAAGTMSRNNSENLADELLTWLRMA